MTREDIVVEKIGEEFSFVKNIPVITGVYKERLYDYMVAQKFGPNDTSIFPEPVSLLIDAFPHHEGTILCQECADSIVEERVTDPDTSGYYNKIERVVDSPLHCSVCECKLQFKMDSRCGAEAVIDWTYDRVKSGSKLQAGDWYDLWSAVQVIAGDDDLWNEVGYIVVDRIGLKSSGE